MPEYTKLVGNRAILGIVQRTFNHVDPRLIDHGARVAYLANQLAQICGCFTPTQRRDICFLAMLHDIGAYKTEEISRIIQFETQDVWDHSIYGYLFLKYFSPFSSLAPAVLFHHADWSFLRTITCDETSRRFAQLLNLCDRADIFFGIPGNTMAQFIDQLALGSGVRFDPEVVALFCRARLRRPTDGETLCSAFLPILEQVPFSDVQVDKLLKMVVFAIDFRSRHTVNHTVTTTSVSRQLAHYLGLGEREREEVVCGALLHDLGKIGIPVEILEFPGKLSPQAMAVMRTHVDLTEAILGGELSPVIRNISLRHHEKLDGSGYPRGLTGEELSVEERVVAVADIVSALCGTRSYKDAFPKEQTLSIIRGMSGSGLIDGRIVAVMEEHFDAIMSFAASQCQPVLACYDQIQQEYGELRGRLAGAGA